MAYKFRESHSGHCTSVQNFLQIFILHLYIKIKYILYIFYNLLAFFITSNCELNTNTNNYYSTAFSRVQITPKTSTNIPRYLYSRRPVWQVFYKSHVQALALQGERWKNGRNARFPEENKECLPNFEIFNENEILETSNDLDDSEISAIVTFRGLALHRKKTSEKLFECTRKNDKWQIWWRASISEKNKWKQNEKRLNTHLQYLGLSTDR